jgi:hypothetical protein
MLNVVIAIKNTVFQVIYFKLTNFIGSSGSFFSMSSTNDKSHSGKSFRTGGLELNTPYNNLIM